ncbi:hypothetical protein [Jiella pelagia]|nr:hypothetical protein [Jiella pelagia]
MMSLRCWSTGTPTWVAPQPSNEVNGALQRRSSRRDLASPRDDVCVSRRCQRLFRICTGNAARPRQCSAAQEKSAAFRSASAAGATVETCSSHFRFIAIAPPRRQNDVSEGQAPAERSGQLFTTGWSNAMTRRILLGILATIAIASYAVPAGSYQPLIVRVVTIGGETGPAFYSSIEQGYRFIGRPGILDVGQTTTPSSPKTEAGGQTMVTAEMENRTGR